MIRPITCVTLLLACGSGLYLYQTKHRVHVLDGQIEQVLHQTSQVRDQIRTLRAEWTLLDEPDRLQQLAGQFLALQPTKPGQFASAADLDARLPPVPEPDATGASAAPVATESPVPSEPMLAAPAPPVLAPTHVAEHPAVHVADAAHPETAHPQSAAPHGPPTPATPRAQLAAAQPARAAQFEPPNPTPSHVVTAALPRPAFLPAPAVPRLGPAPLPAYGGSLLGMAHGAAPPPPAPMWFNWNNR